MKLGKSATKSMFHQAFHRFQGQFNIGSIFLLFRVTIYQQIAKKWGKRNCELIHMNHHQNPTYTPLE